MESVLIVCLSGVMYAGQLLEEFNFENQWIGIKPSSVSDVLMYFNRDRIKEVYLLNGEKKVLIEFDLTEKRELNLNFPENNVQLIRVKGGVTFRGEGILSLDGFSQLTGGVSLDEGTLLSPSLERETLIYIPNKEVEGVFCG